MVGCTYSVLQRWLLLTCPWGGEERKKLVGFLLFGFLWGFLFFVFLFYFFFKKKQPQTPTYPKNKTQQQIHNLQLFPGPFCSGSFTQHVILWGVHTLDEMNELDKSHACRWGECGRKPAFTLQRTVLLSHSNLSSPRSEERRELQSLLPFTCAVPHGIVSFVPPDGDFRLWMSVMKGKFNSTWAPSKLSKLKTRTCQARARSWKVKSLQSQGRFERTV